MDVSIVNGPAVLVLTVAAMLCVVISLFAVVLAGQHRQRRSLQKTEQQLLHMLEQMEDALQAQYASQREEMLRGLYQMNDSLITTFNSFGHSQAEQVQAVVRQNFDAVQSADARQRHLQQVVSDSLKQLDARFNAMEGRTEQRLQHMEEALQGMRRQTADSLSEIRSTVEEKLQSTLDKRLSESFSQVSERLEQVYRSLGEVHSLASGVGDLKKMLGNVKARGTWGEIQLGHLLEQVFTQTQYMRNAEVVPGSGERVEYAVCLPGRNDAKPVLLPIDSKFPQESYQRLADCSQEGDAAATESAKRALFTAVRTEAKRIGKYISPPYSTDFAVMFLPTEGLYAEVVRNAEAVEVIQREQRVLIAGPSTLLALLNSLQMGFRTVAIEKRSAEVWKLLGAVKHDFSGFAANLQKTQERLRQVTDQIDTTFAQTRRIEKRLERVEFADEPVLTAENAENGREDTTVAYFGN